MTLLTPHKFLKPLEKLTSTLTGLERRKFVLDAAVPAHYEPMQSTDLETVAALEKNIYEFPWTAGNFADSLAAGYLLTVARLEDRSMIGYSVLMVALDEAHLLNLSIAQHCQGKGQGTRLLQHALDMARTHQVTRFFLEVRPSNVRAIHLYESFGFQRIGQRKGYYPAAGGLREDAIVMEKLL